MDNKKFSVLMVFGIFLVLSMHSVSAYVNSSTLTINATNGASGSDWFKGGSNQSINFTFTPTPINDSTNVTQLNFSSTNFTFWSGGLLGINNSEWSCTRWSANLVNCSGGTSVDSILNITLNMSLNASYEINHSINVSMLTNGTDQINYSDFYIEVDAVDPTITTPFYAWYRNATSIKTSTTTGIIFNISVSDSGSGGGHCYIDANSSGVNQTISVSSGWCNTTVLNFTGSSEGNQTILLYINDSVNNLMLNNTLILQIDTVNPSPTATCTPTNPTDNGEIVTCSCSGTDATSGINSSLTTATSTTTTSTAGSFTYTCSVTDYGTNEASGTDTFIVTGGSSGAAATSSGGGSGTVSSVKSNIFSTVTPEKVSVMKNFAEETGVKEIKIEVNNEVKNVKVTVSKYDEKPAEVSVEKTGKVYQYMQINTENLVDNLKKAIITIKVEKTWLSDSGLEKENIILSKFDESSSAWNELATTYKEEDDTYYYYDAELTSFSYFAISEKVVVEEVEEEKSIGTILGDIGEEAKSLTWLWIVIVLLVVLAVYVIFSRKK